MAPSTSFDITQHFSFRFNVHSSVPDSLRNYCVRSTLLKHMPITSFFITRTFSAQSAFYLTAKDALCFISQEHFLLCLYIRKCLISNNLCTCKIILCHFYICNYILSDAHTYCMYTFIPAAMASALFKVEDVLYICVHVFHGCLPVALKLSLQKSQFFQHVRRETDVSSKKKQVGRKRSANMMSASSKIRKHFGDCV